MDHHSKCQSENTTVYLCSHFLHSFRFVSVWVQQNITLLESLHSKPEKCLHALVKFEVFSFLCTFFFFFLLLLWLLSLSPFKLRKKKIDWKTHVRDQHNVIYQVMNKFSLFFFCMLIFFSLSLFFLLNYSKLYVW